MPDDHFDYDVFLSFASADVEAAGGILRILSQGGLRVFWSNDTLPAAVGQSFVAAIQDGLLESRHFVLFWTAQARRSNWVKAEYEVFYSQCHLIDRGARRLIVLPDGQESISSLPPFLRSLQIARSAEEVVKTLGQERSQDQAARAIDAPSISNPTLGGEALAAFVSMPTDPAVPGNAVLAQWRTILATYQETAGTDPSRWASYFEVVGQDVLLTSLVAVVAATYRPDLSIVSVLQALDDCPPLLDWDDDSTFIDRWQEKGLADDLRACLSAGGDTAQVEKVQWELLDEFKRIGEKPFGAATTFVLAYVLAGLNVGDPSPALPWLACAALSRRLQTEPANFTDLYFEERLKDLLLYPISPLATTEVPLPLAALQALLWKSRPRPWPPPEEDLATYTWLWPVFCAFSRGSTTVTNNLLTDFLRLATNQDLRGVADFWAALGLLEDYPISREDYRVRRQTALAHLIDRLGVASIWRPYLEALLHDGIGLAAAVTCVRTLEDELRREVQDLGSQAIPRFPEVLDRIYRQEMAEVQTTLDSVARAGGRKGEVLGPGGRPQSEVAEGEMRRLSALVGAVDATNASNLVSIKRRIVSEWKNQLKGGEATERTRNRIEHAVAGKQRDLQAIAACQVLRESPFSIPVLFLEGILPEDARQLLSEADHYVAHLVRDLHYVSGACLPAELPTYDDRALGWFLDAALESNLLSSAPRLYLENLFRAIPADGLDSRALFLEISTGLATSWSFDRHLLQLKQSDEPQVFDFMLAMNAEERRALGGELLTFFDSALDKWRHATGESRDLMDWLAAFRPWEEESDRELIVEAESLTAKEPTSFKQIVEAPHQIDRMRRTLERAQLNARAAVSQSEVDIERFLGREAPAGQDFHAAQLLTRKLLSDASLFIARPTGNEEDNLAELHGAIQGLREHIDGTRSPIITALEGFLPETAVNLPEARERDPTGHRFAEEQFMKEVGIIRDAILHGESSRVRPLIESYLRSLGASPFQIARPRLGVFAMAWCESKLDDENDPERRVQILKDALRCQISLVPHLEGRNVKLLSDLSSRYSAAGSALPSLALFAHLALEIWELESSSDGDSPLEARLRDSPLHEIDVRSALKSIEEPRAGLERGLSFQGYLGLASTLHELRIRLGDVAAEAEMSEQSRMDLWEVLPSVQLVRLVPPSSTRAKDVPTQPLARAIWKLIIAYAAQYGYTHTIHPASFGHLLQDPEWKDLLKTSNMSMALEDVLKYSSSLHNAGTASTRSDAFVRLGDAFQRAARPDVNRRQRARSATVGEVLLRHFADTINDFLYFERPQGSVELTTSFPLASCFLGSDSAWFYLNVRNPESSSVAARKVAVSLEHPRIDRAKTIGGEGEHAEVAKMLSPGEIRGVRVFLHRPWVEALMQRPAPVLLTLEVNHEHGSADASGNLPIHPSGGPASDLDMFPGQDGNIVVGQNLFGREKILEELTRLLQEERNAELKGIRGIGKTSILQEVRVGLPPAKGWIFVIVQKYGEARFRTAVDWYLNVCQRLRQSALPRGSGFATIGDALEAQAGSMVKEAVSRLLSGSGSGDSAATDLTFILKSAASIELPEGERVRPVIVFDQLEALTEMWYEKKDQEENQAQIDNLLSTLRAWSNDDRRSIRWILSGAPSFFDAVDRSVGPVTRARAARGSKTIEVPVLPPEVIETWLRKETERHGVALDSDLPGQLAYISGGHPWVVAIYGYFLARQASKGVHRALTCADLGAAEELLFADSDQMKALKNRLIGDSVEPDQYTHLCYVLLTRCALEASRSEWLNETAIRDFLQRDDEIAFGMLEGKLTAALERLVHIGFLKNKAQKGSESEFALASPFLERFFGRHPDYGIDFPKKALKSIREGTSDPRRTGIPEVPWSERAVPHLWWGPFEASFAGLISEGPGWVSRVLSFCLNCGPIERIRTGGNGQHCLIDPEADATDEASNLLRWANDRLRRLAPPAWQDLSPQSYGGAAEYPSITALALALRRSDVAAAIRTVWDAICGTEAGGHLLGQLERHASFIRLQRGARLGNFKLEWRPSPVSLKWVPCLDAGGLVVREGLLTAILDHFVPRCLLLSARPVSDEVRLADDAHPLRLSYLSINIEWETGGAQEDRLDGSAGWQQRLITALAPFCHVLTRYSETEGEDLSCKSGKIERGPAIAFPWVGEGQYGPHFEWEKLGHHLKECSSGIGLVFPIIHYPESWNRRSLLKRSEI
jgi:hypothetical protein